MQVQKLTFFCIIITIGILAGCSSSVRTSRTSTRGSIRYESLSSGRSTVLRESRGWMGTPYKYGGSAKSGTDCSGFVSRVYAKVGVSLPRRARDMYKVGASVSLNQINPGDLVFFKNTAGKGITHVGIYTGQASFIHASSSSGVISSSLSTGYYKKHFAGARKILR
jgi:probable lipoprotein NlpC